MERIQTLGAVRDVSFVDLTHLSIFKDVSPHGMCRYMVDQHLCMPSVEGMSVNRPLA